MYPTKDMFEYMTEMNRLFPRSNENDMFQSPPTSSHIGFPSPFSLTNQSSSSADSTSPESFPDLSQRPSQHVDTPFIVRRQRPIVGRKIFDKPTEPMKDDTDFPNTIWQDDRLFSKTPPNIIVEQKNYTQNVFYELFPAENKGYEFKTPVKNTVTSYTSSPVNNSSSFSPCPSFSPQQQSFSPQQQSFSPQQPSFSPQQPSFSPQRPSLSPSTLNFGIPRLPFSFSNQIGPSTSRQQSPNKMCTFCRKNGETPLVYMTHTVRERVGNRTIVTCPILRSHVCSTCGAMGDDAHTITYCPVLRSTNNGVPLQSTTITLKNTRVKSNGRRRY